MAGNTNGSKNSGGTLLKLIAKHVHTTGEEIKNDFPNKLRLAIEEEEWRKHHDAEGRPFESLAEWLCYSLPNGASMGLGRFAITYQDALALTKEAAPDVHTALLEHAPKQRPGRKKKGEDKIRAVPHVLPRDQKGSTKDVLAARLAQEYPDIYQAYLRNEYRSITAAAEAAGLVKSSNAPLKRLKENWRKASTKERREFLNDVWDQMTATERNSFLKSIKTKAQ